MAKWLETWATVIGLVMTALGIIVAFSLPVIAARWAGPDVFEQEFWARVRFVVGAVLVLAGTVLQVYGAWPR